MQNKCRYHWYLARVQPLISRIAHVGWNSRTTEMLIDKSKMAVDSFFSFLNLRKQHTNLELKLLFKIETQNHPHWAKSLH